VIPRPTALVLCSGGASCGCLGSLELSDTHCRRVWKAGDGHPFWISSFHFSPNGRAAILLGHDETEAVVAVVNFEKGQHLFRDTLDAYPVCARWLSNQEFEVTVSDSEGTAHTERRYRVDLSAARPRLSRLSE
jgi:hypothetical protein